MKGRMLGGRVVCALLVGCLMAAAAGAFELAIISPEFNIPVFGVHEVRVEIYPQDLPVEVVEVFVDGQFVGSDSEVPYAVVVDFGQENTGHEVVVVAKAADGRQVTQTMNTASIVTDEQFDVDLQQLYVTAEQGEDRVLDLRREDFEVYENRRRQELITFERGDIPYTVMLLIDTSDSMRGEPLEFALEGARLFARNMRPLDEVQVVLFSDRTKLRTPFSGFVEMMDLSLSKAEASGGSAVADHLQKALLRIRERQGRRAILLLSDGVDVHSTADMSAVARAAQFSPAIVYWVRLGGGNGARHRSAWRSPEQHARELELLQEVIESSGGRVISIGGVEEIPAAFDAVTRELRQQYVLGFYPPDREPGTWRRVQVKVSRPGVALRTRDGYYSE